MRHNTWSSIVVICLCAGHASAQSLQPAFATTPAGSPLGLTIGLAEYDGSADQCGNATTLSASVGDQINVCYTVSNDSAVTLNYHTLADDVRGTLFHNFDVAIPPGQSYQYNRVFAARASQAPTSTWTAQDALAGYTASAGSATFVPIDTSGTALDLSDDDDLIVTAPFPITLYGQSSTQVCVSNNGFLVLSNQFDCSGYSGNTALPLAGPPAPALFPFWDDLYDGGNVYYDTLGTAPARQFVVEWFEKNHYDANQDDPGGITFEVVFNEADATVDFVYQTVEFDALDGAADHGLSATVGLQDTTSLFNQYSYNAAALSDGQAIHWAASAPIVYGATQQITLDVGAPLLALDASTLSATASAGQTASMSLLIGNSGDRDLNWSIGEAQAEAHFFGTAGAPRFYSPATDVEVQRPNLLTLPPTRPDLSLRKPKRAQGDASVPAFITDEGAGGFQFGSIDAAAPSTFSAIAAVPNNVVYRTGTFVADDFGKEFVAGNSNDLSTRAIATIDTTTGLLTAFANSAPLESNEAWIGLKWDESTSTLYGAACDPVSASGECHLYYVDPLNGSVQEGPAISGFDGAFFLLDIAISPQGLMYAIELFSGDLLAIDKITGATQPIGNTGVAPNFAQSLAFDASTGILYWPSYDVGGEAVMYTIDAASGNVHRIGNLIDGDDQFAMAIARASSACAHPSDTPWLSESASAGTTAVGASDALTVTFDATSLAPGTYTANVCINTNDVDHRQTAVPVTFIVTPASTDRIFADGFEDVST